MSRSLLLLAVLLAACAVPVLQPFVAEGEPRPIISSADLADLEIPPATLEFSTAAIISIAPVHSFRAGLVGLWGEKDQIWHIDVSNLCFGCEKSELDLQAGWPPPPDLAPQSTEGK